MHIWKAHMEEISSIREKGDSDISCCKIKLVFINELCGVHCMFACMAVVLGT